MKPLRCRLGRHTGQENGGTMMYHCPRCGGDYWQSWRHREQLRAVEATADLYINAGKPEKAIEYAEAQIKRIAGGSHAK